MSDSSAPSELAVPSPCVAVCRMEELDRTSSEALCAGCLRSLEEIAAWPSATDDYKKAVWDSIERRRAKLMEGAA